MKNINKNSLWWNDVSIDYLEKTQRIISLTVDKLLTNENKPVIKVPIAPLQDIEDSIRIDILENLSDKNRLFIILNDYYRKLVREIGIGKIEDWGPKSDILKDAYYKFNIREKDLDEYILLELKSADVLEELKEVKRQVEKKIEEKTAQQEVQQTGNIPKDKIIVQNDQWIIAEAPQKGKVYIYYNGHGIPLEISEKTRWLKVFQKYVENTRLLKGIIIATWGLSVKTWGSGEKREENYIPTIHRQIKEGLRKHPTFANKLDIRDIVYFERQKGTEKGFYRLVTK